MKAPTGNIASIDEYIVGFPEPVQAILSLLRSSIRLAAPQAVEKISYRIPTFYFNGHLVYFAAFKRHIGFYPTASGIAAFREELKCYKTSKGAVRFPMDQPLPLKPVGEIVAFRLQENSRKQENGKRSGGRLRKTEEPGNEIQR
ncbi:MAG: DUF1801 domain-containing protein [Sterolibacterium sp.]|jgi:uncharacterized protein YdhG (YjbR/CyaY superfamily)